MKILILIDAKNFENGFINLCKKRKEFRYVDFYKLNNFIMDYLKTNLQYKFCQLMHLRTYFYTGEYTDLLIEKIEKYFRENPEETDLLSQLLEKCRKEQEKQKKFFNFAKNHYFFEIRAKPLQFSYSDTKVIQKGVDVQLAADLVDFTHKDMFDIAVILSGDIDLLESVKIAKSMGKHVILFGDESVTAEEMKKYADMFINISRFTEEQLDKFSHFHRNKEEDVIIDKKEIEEVKQ